MKHSVGYGFFQISRDFLFLHKLKGMCISTFDTVPELVQGGRLKLYCVRTRGFEPHRCQIVNYTHKL